MKTNNIENIWAEHSRELQSRVHLNAEELHQIQFGKVKIALRGLLIRRIFENILFLVFFVLLLQFAVTNFQVWEYMASGLVLAVFACIGFIGGFRQVMLIGKLDFSGPVTSFQTEMEKLKAYSLQTLKLVLMSIPFYFAYIIIGFKSVFGLNVLRTADPQWLIFNLCLSIILIPVFIWVVRKLSYRSKSNWIRKLIRDNGGKETDASLEFLAELEKYREEGDGDPGAI
jgi:hypothetical protein